MRDMWEHDGEILTFMRATRTRRVALCAALFWLVWSWHFLIALMFLPTMIAFGRSHRNWPVVFVLNLFLGWTPTWLLLMVYAIYSRTPVPPLARSAVLMKANVRYSE